MSVRSNDDEPRRIPPRSHSSLSIRTVSSYKPHSSAPIALKHHIRDLKNQLEDIRFEIRKAKTLKYPDEDIAELRIQWYDVERQLGKAKNDIENALSSSREPSPERDRSVTPPIETAYVDEDPKPMEDGNQSEDDEQVEDSGREEEFHSRESVHRTPAVSAPFPQHRGLRPPFLPSTPVRDTPPHLEEDPNISAAIRALTLGRRFGESDEQYQARQNASRRQEWATPLPTASTLTYRHPNARKRASETPGIVPDVEFGRKRLIRPPRPGDTPNLHPARFTPQIQPHTRPNRSLMDQVRQPQGLDKPVPQDFDSKPLPLPPKPLHTPQARSPPQKLKDEDIKNEGDDSPTLNGSVHSSRRSETRSQAQQDDVGSNAGTRSNASRTRSQAGSAPRSSTPRPGSQSRQSPHFEPPPPPIPPAHPPSDGGDDPSSDGSNHGHGGGGPRRDNQSDRNSRRSNQPSRNSRNSGRQPPVPPNGDPDPSDHGGPSLRAESPHSRRSNRSEREDEHTMPNANCRDRNTPFGVIPPSNSRLPGEEFFDYQEVDHSQDLSLRDRVFKTFADRIEFKLHKKRTGISDSKSRKELANSMPKLIPYNGECSVITLDNFIRAFCERCKVLGLTGPPRIETQDGITVISDEDSNCVTLLGANLAGAAKEWYNEVVDNVPFTFDTGMDPREHEYTFLDVFRGLFNRFILQSALYEMTQVFESIRYHPTSGARRLFADLSLFARRMPSPPKLYDFKFALMVRLPNDMRELITNSGITAERNTVNNIMQKALAIEEGWKANQFYTAAAPTAT
ncbi:hypothetical protein VNI00_008186 [Paramarasmius palmivorus]|uniref:Gag protein n=1 Tax=Paramarasmius palmivorus TaxID=297713 RepID=A0AAW0CXJ1_9AGAR